MSDQVDLTAPPAYTHPELETAVDELAEAFAGTYSRETVASVVVDSYTQVARTARIPTHLPLLAHRFARDRLHAHAIVEGHLMTDRPEVLFV